MKTTVVIGLNIVIEVTAVDMNALMAPGQNDMQMVMMK